MAFEASHISDELKRQREIADSGDTGLGEQPAQDFIRIEMLNCDLTRGSRVQWVICTHSMHRLDSFVNGCESEQAFARWNGILEPSPLQDDRPASGEITSRAVAEPPATRSRVATFNTGEFGARAFDVPRGTSLECALCRDA